MRYGRKGGGGEREREKERKKIVWINALDMRRESNTRVQETRKEKIVRRKKNRNAGWIGMRRRMLFNSHRAKTFRHSWITR